MSQWHSFEREAARMGRKRSPSAIVLASGAMSLVPVGGLESPRLGGRDGVPARSQGGVSRRTLLSGVLATALLPFLGARDAGPIGVGHAAGTGLDPALVRAFCAAVLGRAVVLAPFASMASLRDHLEAGLLDAALLVRSAPGAAFVSGLLPAGPVRATLVLPSAPASASLAPAIGRAPVVARAAADPAADAALARLWGARAGPGEQPNWLTLAPAQLVPNVAAGLIDAALVFGEVEAAPDVTLVPLGKAWAWALAPRLALARRAFGEA